MGLIQLQPLDKNAETAIDRIISCDNYNRTRQFSIILFLANLIFLMIDFNNRAKGLWSISDGYYYVFYTHIVLGFVTFMSILVTYKVTAHSASEVTLFHKLYVILFAFFALNYSAVISGWVSLEINRPNNVYLIACYSVAILYNFKSKIAAFLYGLSCITFMICLTISQEDPYLSFGHYSDVFLLVVIACFLSTVLFKYKQRNLLQNHYLEDLVLERTREMQASNDLLKKEIIERKRTESEMARLEKLNLIAEMAASISHEVRNPMTTVKGFLQLLKNKQGSRDKEFFNIMIEELDRANSILTEFLSITRNKPTSLECHNINDIVISTLPLLQADAQNNDKLLNAELNDVSDLQLDVQEIRQLLLNLVRNGFEAMTSGGQVSIRTYSSNGEVVLVVSDEGTGIEEIVLEKLGTPFYTTKEKGTGLGLAVCYGIVSRHNGRISVETSPSGSTFYVYFKLDDRN